jgi:hypothetical protein
MQRFERSSRARSGERMNHADEQRLIESFRQMTESDKSNFLRMLLRVRNGDARAEQLMARCAAGEITRRQLFEAFA